MALSRFQEVKRKFNELSPKKRDELLHDIYKFSNDTKLFLENRLLDGSHGGEYVEQMKRETIGNVYSLPPEDIDGSVVNGIISKAKKSGVNIWTVMKLEQLAYQGFIEFLNEYGADSETYDSMACRHLENYLKLVKEEITDQQERDQFLSKVKRYLEDHNNMYTDGLDEIFERETGMKIER
ncbi:hypothetical protein A3I42_03160 [Candidatus Uhrbacteria bacterium RIFCSPLOWO2_02_FULL_49_11]|uniref:Uncharacterized protein n=1 Tax=Candidatus Uhrbacteria bacterium RIFCSPLOWO2_02_FULL_49_11 TaxID=1802409 RepID=A0A1F7VBN5_9BACT|nr:MAG: hypothetical protein A3I42_03160 [Candidatus Uhrbacteria bacterium RIFCSPLOWO2_02_FULL_49_11]